MVKRCNHAFVRSEQHPSETNTLPICNEKANPLLPAQSHDDGPCSLPVVMRLSLLGEQVFGAQPFPTSTESVVTRRIAVAAPLFCNILFSRPA
jgi:hypothetical protein